MQSAIRAEAAGQSEEYGNPIRRSYSYAMFKRSLSPEHGLTADAFKPSQMVNATKRGVSENTAARGEG